MTQTAAYESKVTHALIARRIKPYLDFAPILVGILLALAACLKIWHARYFPLLNDSIVHSRLFITLLCQVELVTAALLWLKSLRVFGVCASMLLFGCFAIYNIQLLERGEAICNCLGMVSTSPVTMFAVDVMVLVSLCFWSFQRYNMPAISRRLQRTLPNAVPSFFCLVLAVATPLLARPAVLKTGALSLVLAADFPSHDFGEIEAKNARLSYVFNLSNNGPADVIIDRIATTCGCTTASSNASRIAPHQSAALPVTIDWTRKIGFCREGIELTVHSGSTHDLVNLLVTGSVHVPVRTSTRLLDFGLVTLDNSSTRVIQLAPDSRGKALQVQQVIVSGAPFHVVAVKADGRPVNGATWTGSLVEIEMQYSPTQSHSEPVGNLKLIFTDPEFGTVDIGLVARVQQPVFVIPSQAVLVAGTAPTILSIYAPQGVISALEQCSPAEAHCIEISELKRSANSSWWSLAISGKEASGVGKRTVQINLSDQTTVNFSVTVIR